MTNHRTAGCFCRQLVPLRSILPESDQNGSGVPALKSRTAISCRPQDLRAVGQGSLPCPGRESSPVTARSQSRRVRLPGTVLEESLTSVYAASVRVVLPVPEAAAAR